MKRPLLLLPLLALAAGCASPRIKVASGTDAYALWINYRPIVMAAIPETAGVARTNANGAIDIPGSVEKVLLVNSTFTKKKELVRHCAVLRPFGYWRDHVSDGIPVDEDLVGDDDISRLSRFFTNPILEERLTTDHSIYDAAKSTFLECQTRRQNDETRRE